MKVGRPIFLMLFQSSVLLGLYPIILARDRSGLPKLLRDYHPVSLTSLFPMDLCMILQHPPYKVNIAI